MTGPITIAEAREAGLEWSQLQQQEWRRVGPGIYAALRLGSSPVVALAAACRRLPPGGVFSGLTAAWLHGVDVAPCDPIEVTVPIGSGVSGRAGLRVRKAAFDDCDIVTRQDQSCTTMARTLQDIAQRLTVVEAVVVTDMALHAGLVALEELREKVSGLSGRKGVKRFRRVVALAEPGAESPMETRLRLLLVLARLPRPEVQVGLYDEAGEFVARADLYYPNHRLVVEYDGEWHSDTLTADDRRNNRLADAGYTALRFTKADVRNTPASVVAQVRGFLKR